MNIITVKNLMLSTCTVSEMYKFLPNAMAQAALTLWNQTELQLAIILVYMTLPKRNAKMSKSERGSKFKEMHLVWSLFSLRQQLQCIHSQTN